MLRSIAKVSVVVSSLGFVATGCSTVESAITGEGADTTPAAVAAPTTAEPEPTTTTQQGYVSEGNGLSADELRQMLDAVVASQGAATDIQPFGFTFPVDAPEGGELLNFDVDVSDTFMEGDAQRIARIKYQYPEGALLFEAVEEFYEETALELGVDFEPVDGNSENRLFVSTELDDPIPGQRFELGARFSGEKGSTMEMELATPFGNRSVVGDPEVYSSWFDGLVPVPDGGAFVAGGAEWSVLLSDTPGSTLNAEFEFLKRDELNLKDEARELAENYGLSANEDNGDLILENDEIIATYDFGSTDLLRLSVYFKV